MHMLWRNWRPELSAESLILISSLLITLGANGLFWSQAMSSAEAGQGPVAAGFALSLLVLVAAAHALILLPVSGRWILKPALMLLIPVTVSAAYYMKSYTVFLDPNMLRNVLHTELKEARELLSWRMLLVVLGVSLPLQWLLSRVRIRAPSWRRAILRRSLFALALVTLSVMVLLPNYQRLAALMRNQHSLRYLVTPANLLVSSYRVLRSDAAEHHQVRVPIDPAPQRNVAAGQRPRLLILVLGETVRAANWGLAGYQRQTTPELAQRNVVAFNDVRACGSSTEVSVPCMFSYRGRHDYDESAIRSEESLLHLLQRAGVETQWIDNQTGCKGVCDGLIELDIRGDEDPARCHDGVCLDEVMLPVLKRLLNAPPHDQVIVLHMLGNHGPAYWQRYPKAFAEFQPECKTVNLADCSRRSITNSYDNAVLYADYLLSQVIDLLAALDDRDAALLYVSDHGESLGEGGLYLHGVPYLIAPEQQLKVPMLWWLSSGLRDTGIDACLRQRAQASADVRPISHDMLFHSVLSFMQVRSALYDPDYDLLANCRGGLAPVAVERSDAQPLRSDSMLNRDLTRSQQNGVARSTAAAHARASQRQSGQNSGFQNANP